MRDRSRFFPSEVTSTDFIEYRATWKWKSGVTRQKAQQNLRGLLRSCCRDSLKEPLDVLKSIKLSKSDNARLESQPFTEHQVTSFPLDPGISLQKIIEDLQVLSLQILFRPNFEEVAPENSTKPTNLLPCSTSFSSFWCSPPGSAGEATSLLQQLLKDNLREAKVYILMGELCKSEQDRNKAKNSYQNGLNRVALKSFGT